MDVSTQRPINILSLDGNSNGLPALYVLEEMFSRLTFDLKSDTEPSPCEYFDVIGGTGTGALIALLLGRMKMTTTEAIEAYMKLAPLLSLPSAKDEDERARHSRSFEDGFREILEVAGFDANSPLIDENSPRTVLFTLNIVSMYTPVIVRSYHSRTSKIPPCTILQAACACVASQEVFTPVTIGRGHRKVTLCDATTGYANPTSEILREAKEAVSGEGKVATVVSLGTETKIIRMSSTELESREMELVRTSADCERIHEELQNRLRETGTYHRFRVTIEPQISSEDIFSHISTYLQQGIISSAVDAVTKSVQTRTPGPSLQDINSITPVEITLRPRPSLVDNFIGREEILYSMREMHFNDRPGDVARPAITVLTGLGGSGKTQIALKFAFEYESRHSDPPVYFIDGSKEATLKTELETITHSQGPNYRSASWQDTLMWLATKSKKWLLIIDNVDDPSVKLSSFIPRCTHGHIIITTRDATRRILAPNSTYAVEGLSASDAVMFLLKTSGYEFSPTNETRAKGIVDELGYLPLALAHAAAYISIHQCLSTFLSAYRQSRAHLLEISPDLLQGYPHSVAATIQMSLDRLSPSAKDLLRIFAHLDARSIAYAVLAKAAERNFRHVEMTEEDELLPETLEQARVLMKIFCPNQEWVPVAFEEIISMCLQYSLLRVASQNEERFYSMHILVQGYLKDNASGLQGYTLPQMIVRLLGSTITTSKYDYDHLAFNRLLLPHIRLIGADNPIEPGDNSGFGAVLLEMGDRAVAIAHLERCLELWKQRKGENDQSTFCVMILVGNCYHDMGREEKALEIRERTLEISRRVWGDDSRDTLDVMHNLALSYSVVGREQEALELREKILEKYKLLFGDENRGIIIFMSSLAISYAAVGQPKEALELDKVAVEKCKRLLGHEHQQTLDAMTNLASSYSALERRQEALELEETVLEKRRRLLGDEHPNTLLSMHNLASSYSAVGREQQALELREIVLEKRRVLLGDHHRDTFKSMRHLGSSYQILGRDEEALPLQRFCLAKYTATLGEEHTSTLLMMCHLSLTYWKLKMFTELKELIHTALPLHERILGSDHKYSDALRELKTLAENNDRNAEIGTTAVAGDV